MEEKRKLEDENVEEQEPKKQATNPLLNRIVEAIRELKSHTGSSSTAIFKVLKNVSKEDIKEAIKEGVETKVLTKVKMSYLVTGDPKYPDLSDKITVKTVEEGSGEPVKKGDSILVTYQGLLKDGAEVEQGQIDFNVMEGEVIKGFDQAVVGMKVGEKRIADIPASLAYGKRGTKDIPPDSDLVFHITLDKIL